MILVIREGSEVTIWVLEIFEIIENHEFILNAYFTEADGAIMGSTKMCKPSPVISVISKPL